VQLSPRCLLGAQRRGEACAQRVGTALLLHRTVAGAGPYTELGRRTLICRVSGRGCASMRLRRPRACLTRAHPCALRPPLQVHCLSGHDQTVCSILSQAADPQVRQGSVLHPVQPDCVFHPVPGSRPSGAASWVLLRMRVVAGPRGPSAVPLFGNHGQAELGVGCGSALPLVRHPQQVPCRATGASRTLHKTLCTPCADACSSACAHTRAHSYLCCVCVVHCCCHR